MVSDAKLHEQTYSYFLAEAQDLLQTIEQNLLSLRQDRSAAKVHELMRAAHTLKGAAASVKFDSMKSIAHSFEDVFKALYKPEVEIDAELEALLYEGYDCLRSPLTTAIAGIQCQDGQLLDRAEIIFSKIRSKLGKHFDPGAALPTSADLGFDIAQSLFETGVKERLEQLESAISHGDDRTIAQTLQTQTEVFLGLAESLNLPGFGEIAQTTLKAMQQQPDQVREIAQAALTNLRQGQAAVLSGDRVRGGTVSVTLQGFVRSSQTQNQRQSSRQTWRRIKNFVKRSLFEESEPPIEQSVEAPQEIFSVDPELEAFADQFEAWPTELPETNTDLGFELWDAVVEEPSIGPQSEPLQSQASVQGAPQKSAQDTVRVSLSHLESLNFTTSELLIQQNQQLLQDERLQVMLAELQHQMEQHQRALAQLQDWALMAPERSAKENTALVTVGDLKQAFDTLELDRYNDLNLLLQTAIRRVERIDQSSEAIDFLIRESRVSRNKQGRLLTNLRDDLMDARMMPIGAILNRFPQVVQQLRETYGKNVQLKLTGTQVMVDKALAEKLYQPLLHLVRNAFDHGLESDVVRQHQGKGFGEIEIRAYQQGNRTLIEVSDNGKGLDLERICQRGFEQHRLSSNQVDQVAKSDLLNLLFEPGFSTAEQVTELSGRGVGLDVVRSQIRAMKGNVTVDSIPDQGTTFALQLPLTLISTRLLICQASTAIYGFPSDEVEKILALDTAKIDQIGNQRTLRWEYEGEEHTVAIQSLGQLISYKNWLFGMQAQVPETFGASPTLTTSILMLRRQNHWIGLEVDRVLGEQELVLRPMGSAIAPPRYIYGCSVLGDGRTLLAIDAAALVEQNQPQPSAPIAIAPPVQRSSSRASVLVIDDSITVRQALTLTLEESGFQVVQAHDGLDAIAQLQQHPEIQFITCDVEMPRLNGFEFLMRYAQEPQLAQVPVVMLTSRSNDKHQQLAKQLGAAAYLTKPFDPTQLVQLVHQFVSGKVV